MPRLAIWKTFLCTRTRKIISFRCNVTIRVPTYIVYIKKIYSRNVSWIPGNNGNLATGTVSSVAAPICWLPPYQRVFQIMWSSNPENTLVNLQHLPNSSSDISLVRTGSTKTPVLFKCRRGGLHNQPRNQQFTVNRRQLIKLALTTWRGPHFCDSPDRVKCWFYGADVGNNFSKRCCK